MPLWHNLFMFVLRFNRTIIDYQILLRKLKLTQQQPLLWQERQLQQQEQERQQLQRQL